MSRIDFKAKGKRSAKGHPAGYVRIKSGDQWLHSFWSGWLEEGDDPSCWTSDESHALWLSPEDAALIMRDGCCGFTAATIEQVAA